LAALQGGSLKEPTQPLQGGPELAGTDPTASETQNGLRRASLLGTPRGGWSVSARDPSTRRCGVPARVLPRERCAGSRGVALQVLRRCAGIW
jgi:hypothetical protein